jgi:hypothetical protein
LEVLQERPGLWKLVQDMLVEDPTERLSSSQARARWQTIIEGGPLAEDEQDGDFVRNVLAAQELCQIPDTRPLHYVATLACHEPLGLILSEFDASSSSSSSSSSQEEEDDDYDKDWTEHDKLMWHRVRQEAFPGEVFVKGVVPGSQADELGIFEIGDRLQGVGDIRLTGGGFEMAVKLVRLCVAISIPIDVPIAHSTLFLYYTD